MNYINIFKTFFNIHSIFFVENLYLFFFLIIIILSIRGRLIPLVSLEKGKLSMKISIARAWPQLFSKLISIMQRTAQSSSYSHSIYETAEPLGKKGSLLKIASFDEYQVTQSSANSKARAEAHNPCAFGFIQKKALLSASESCAQPEQEQTFPISLAGPGSASTNADALGIPPCCCSPERKRVISSYLVKLETVCRQRRGS